MYILTCCAAYVSLKTSPTRSTLSSSFSTYITLNTCITKITAYEIIVFLHIFTTQCVCKARTMLWQDVHLSVHSVLWHCWLGHLTRKTVSEMTYNVSSGTLNSTMLSYTIRPSVHHKSHAGILVFYLNDYIYPQVFSPLGSPTILVFPHRMGWQYSDGDPLMGASNARGGYEKSRFSTSISLYLRKHARQSYSYYGWRIGNPT